MRPEEKSRSLRWHNAAIAAGDHNNAASPRRVGQRRAPSLRQRHPRTGGQHHVVNGTFALSPPAAKFIQQVAYQSSGNGIMGQPGPLSLAASGTGAFRDGERAIKTFRSPGSSVAISGNRSNSGRMGVTLTVDPPPNSDFPNHVPDAPITTVSQARPPDYCPRGHCLEGETDARRQTSAAMSRWKGCSTVNCPGRITRAVRRAELRADLRACSGARMVTRWSSHLPTQWDVGSTAPVQG